MRSTRAFLVILIFLGVWASGVAVAQNVPAANRVPYDGADTLNGPTPIHIDPSCRILPGSEVIPGKKKAHPYFDSAICSLEAVHDSTHWEEKINGNELDRWFVRVREQTFVLQNIAGAPVVFIVQYDVPKKWFVDSDPQPWQTAGHTAYFRVFVQPGQTERLHVGIRRMWPQKPKPI